MSYKFTYLAAFAILSGCVVENSTRLSPADYLSLLTERQCISSVDEGIRERGMSAFGGEQDHARWLRELECCDRVEACVKGDLDETGLFDRHDWSVVERFFSQRDVTTDYDDRFTVQTMYERLASDDDEARQRVDIIRQSFNSCRTLP